MKKLEIIVILAFMLITMAVISCGRSLNPVEVGGKEELFIVRERININEEPVGLLYVAPYDAEEPERIVEADKVGIILSILSYHDRERLLSGGVVLVGDDEKVGILSMLTGSADDESSSPVWIVYSGNTSWGCIKSCFSDSPGCTPCPGCCSDHSSKVAECEYTSGE